MKSVVLTLLLLLPALQAATGSSCGSRSGSDIHSSPSPSPSPTPTPRPEPLIAYLSEGNLWLVAIDGSAARPVAKAPEGEVITDFAWSPDGRQIYFSIGLQLFEVMIETGNVANAGAIKTAIGLTIERLEMGRDGRTIVIQTLDDDSAPRIFAVTPGADDSRELSPDEYLALSVYRAPVVRAIGEMSVSSGGGYILHKRTVGSGEEIFASDPETGRALQLSDLSRLDGFEESVQTEGGRRIIEAAWSPDGRFAIFTPMQSCSELGLCYGRLYLADHWGGPQVQLSREMMIATPQEWSRSRLLFDDGNRVMVFDVAAGGAPRQLAEGNRPKWQPVG